MGKQESEQHRPELRLTGFELEAKADRCIFHCFCSSVNRCTKPTEKICLPGRTSSFTEHNHFPTEQPTFRQKGKEAGLASRLLQYHKLLKMLESCPNIHLQTCQNVNVRPRLSFTNHVFCCTLCTGGGDSSRMHYGGKKQAAGDSVILWVMFRVGNLGSCSSPPPETLL